MNKRREFALSFGRMIPKNPEGTRAEWRFLLLICVSALIILVGFGISVAYYARKEQAIQDGVLARAFLMQTRRNISLWIDGEISALETVANDADIIDALANFSDPKAVARGRRVLKNFHSSHAESYFISITPIKNPKEAVFYSNSLKNRLALLQQQVRNIAIDGASKTLKSLPSLYSYLYTSANRNKNDRQTPLLIISRYVEKDGKRVGLLSMGVRLDYLSIRFVHPDILGQSVNLTVTNDKGHVIADNAIERILDADMIEIFRKILPLRFLEHTEFHNVNILPGSEVMVENIPIRAANHNTLFDSPWYLVLSKKDSFLLGGKEDFFETDIFHLMLVALFLLASSTLSIGSVFITKIRTARQALQNVNTELEHSNYIDALTGLPNRKAYVRDIEKLEQEKNAPLGIVSFDVDGLKIINDMVGHLEGDRLLIDSASILAEIVSSPATLYRTGGDEFIALYPSCDLNEVQNIRHTLNRKLGEFNVNRDEDFMRPAIHISCGYAIRERADIEINELYQLADDKMYRYKRANNMRLRIKLLDLAEKALLAIEPGIDEIQKISIELIDVLVKVDPEYLQHRKSLLLLSKYHDIGKITQYSTGNAILLDSRAENQKIAEAGFRVAMVFPQTFPIAHLILRQYEWWNERNDDMLSEDEEIPLELRVFSVIHIFVKGLLAEKDPSIAQDSAIDALLNSSGKQLDPQIVDFFISEVIPEYHK